MPQWVNLSNLFTAIRLALVPFIIQAILSREHMRAGVLFAAAASTDAIDGSLARHFGWTTRAGAYLDPVADKILLSAVYIALAMVGTAPWWFVAIIFGRDVFILVGSALVLLLGGAISLTPSVLGKASTFLQIVTAATWLASYAMRSPVLGSVAGALLWPTAALALASGLHYGMRGARLL